MKSIEKTVACSVVDLAPFIFLIPGFNSNHALWACRESEKYAFYWGTWVGTVHLSHRYG